MLAGLQQLLGRRCLRRQSIFPLHSEMPSESRSACSKGRRRTDFLVGPGYPWPAVRPRRGASAGLPDRRCAVAGPGIDPSAVVCCAAPWRQNGSRWCSPFASRLPHRNSTDCPSFSSRVWAITTRGGCWRGLRPDVWTPRCVIGSWPETRGNPLALLELPRSLTPAQMAGGFGLSRCGDAVGPHRAELPAAHRIASRRGARAAVRCGCRARGRRDPCCCAALDKLGIAADTVVPAENAGLIELGSRVRFRHPLVRSAAYRAAAPETRRRGHAALADATDPQTDPDLAGLAPAHSATPAP